MTAPKNGFTIHDKQSAPDAAKPVLDQVEQGFGFVPNLLGIAAESPAALEAYVTLNGLLKQKTAFTAAELEVLLLAISAHNSCGYCVAAHTGNAERAGADAATIEAIRTGAEIPDPKLHALATFASTLIDKRGFAGEADIQAFLNAGYTRQHMLDVIAALAMKTISNYTNHIADTPLDTPLQAKAWEQAA